MGTGPVMFFFFCDRKTENDSAEQNNVTGPPVN